MDDNLKVETIGKDFEELEIEYNYKGKKADTFEILKFLHTFTIEMNFLNIPYKIDCIGTAVFLTIEGYISWRILAILVESLGNYITDNYMH